MKINIPANTKKVILNIVSNEMIELKNAVNEAKIKLGLSNSELSKLIGHSRNYLSEALRVGVSQDTQNAIVISLNVAVKNELINRGIYKPDCSIDVSCEQDQSVVTDFVSKAYHDQEVRRLENVADIEKQLRDELNQERLNLSNDLITSATKLDEQTQNVRMLNMEVEQFKQAKKLTDNDLAIANRDKNFMKRKLQDKNLVINWLLASTAFFFLFLVAKCAGWV